MTLATTVSMGGTTPNVNNEIGQANTQTVSIGDRAVRNLANVATGAIGVSSLQNKGQAVQSGIAAFTSTGLNIYGWIDAGGWGALSATLANAFGADPIALDARGGTTLSFLMASPYGIFVYGSLTTSGLAYSATLSRNTTGSFNNDVRDVSFIGTSANYGDVYAYGNANRNGLFLVSNAVGLITPQLWSYITSPFNIVINWVETGTSATSAYITRAGSSTQKIGIVSGINLTNTPTLAYFSAQGTDTYYGLANSANVIFAAGTTGLANAWNLGGTAKFAAPTVQVAGPGICRVNSAGTVVFYANGTSPFVHAWSFNAGAFGTKFANPATLITDPNLATQIYVHPSDKAVCFIISGKPFVYAWDNVTGFGALFTNPIEINATRSVAAFFNRSF